MIERMQRAMETMQQAGIEAGTCAWCDEPCDRTVCFEECPHATPCCSAHFDEYFEYVGWEWMLDTDDGRPRPECPDCCG